MDSGSKRPRADVRLLDRVEAHLESYEILGVDVGDGWAALDFLASLPMGDVEALLRGGLDERDLRRILVLVEHRKGQLEQDELPFTEAQDRADALESMRRHADEHARKRRRDRR
jgi:hypothetical protein